MRDRTRNLLAMARREFGRQTLLLGALFIVTLTVGIFVGTDGLLEHFKVIAGRPVTTLEAGAIIFLLSAVALLAMGMSVSAEVMAREKVANQ